MSDEMTNKIDASRLDTPKLDGRLDGRVLDTLFALIESRKNQADDNSYTAKLLAGGAALAARKLSEEAVETLIAALQNDTSLQAGGQGGVEVVKEAADVLYHLLVVLAVCDVTLDQVYAELERREGVSGLDEKARRKK